MKKMATVFVLILTLAASAHAKAYFAPKAKMIATSDVIAVVNITAVESLEPQKQYGNQLANATIQEIIKGDVEKDAEIEFKVKCFYPCAITQVSTGQYLVFLSRDGKELRGNNWHLSYRPIKDGSIEWYKDETSCQLEKKEMEKVLAEVRTIMKSPQPPALGDAAGACP